MKTLALTFAAALLASFPAFAGDMQYGCVGQLSKTENIAFNRQNLVITSKQLNGDLLKLDNDAITTFESDDNNSGMLKEMGFTHVWGEGSKDVLTLKEISVKAIGHKEEVISCTGTGNRVRDITHDTSTRIYEVTLPRGAKPVRVILKCWDYEVSACG